MITKFKIGDVLNFDINVEIRFNTEGREIDLEELKEAIDLFIHRWVKDDDICPVLEEKNDENCD